MNQIIEKGLHTADDETKLYTTNLVDKLEQVRYARSIGCLVANADSVVIG